MTGPLPERHNSADQAFVDALPKVELHAHLEGSMPPDLLLQLRKRHGIEELPATEDALRDWYAFKDFDHFITVYLTSVRALRDGADFFLLARTVADHLAAQNIRYVEMTFTPWLHMRRGLPFNEFFAGLEEGRMEAERRTGIQMRWVTDVPGDMGIEAAEQTLEAVLDASGAGRADTVVGFGLGGPEVPRPPFAGVFEAARQAGLQPLPHAGETAGPESIWDALDHLGAVRIGHGIAAVHDRSLLQRLRAEQIVLEVCPTSNVRTRVVPDLSDHPLRTLLDAGIAVTVNSDDPPMFGTSLRDEFLAAVGVLGLSRDQLVACVGTAINGSFMEQARKRELLAELGTQRPS